MVFRFFGSADGIPRLRAGHLAALRRPRRLIHCRSARIPSESKNRCPFLGTGFLVRPTGFEPTTSRVGVMRIAEFIVFHRDKHPIKPAFSRKSVTNVSASFFSGVEFLLNSASLDKMPQSNLFIFFCCVNYNESRRKAQVFSARPYIKKPRISPRPVPSFSVNAEWLPSLPHEDNSKQTLNC